MSDYLYFDIMETNSAYNMRIGFLNGQMGVVYFLFLSGGSRSILMVVLNVQVLEQSFAII